MERKTRLKAQCIGIRSKITGNVDLTAAGTEKIGRVADDLTVEVAKFTLSV